ncbi:hypothetical protein Q7F20_03000 [Curtobacterium sp. A7_M15]|jgi:hypothetical protein|nr:hypothetical protein [Curtobacterium sp. A7_M15]MDP4332324.1 hypothetical protein [Curtobacterium sp. A7_M15]
MRATPDGTDPDLDAADAFGHPAVDDPTRDDTVWPDDEGDEVDADDFDV